MPESTEIPKSSPSPRWSITRSSSRRSTIPSRMTKSEPAGSPDRFRIVAAAGYDCVRRPATTASSRSASSVRNGGYRDRNAASPPMDLPPDPSSPGPEGGANATAPTRRPAGDEGLTGVSGGAYIHRSLSNIRSIPRRAESPGDGGVQAVRRGGRGSGRTGRRDALGLRLAGPPVRGRRRDRALADRGPMVGRRPGPRVLAGRGPRRGRLGPVPRPPARPLAHGAPVGLNRGR